MDTGLAKTLIEEMARNLPVTLVPFFRGEPLLHPDWKEIIAYAKAKGVGPIQITTNATLMDRQIAETILDLELDFISFSLDSIYPDIYEKNRRGAKYNQVLSNILRLLELKAKRGCRLPEVQVSAVDTPQHHLGLDSFVSFWQDKVDRVRIYIEHSQDGHPGSIAAPLPQFDYRQPCHKVFTDMVVYWDGTVAVCNHDWTREKSHFIGNVREGGIAANWQSKRYQDLRIFHKKGQLNDEPPCDFCDHWKMYYLPDGYLGKIYEGI